LDLDEKHEKKSSARGQHIWMESKDTPMMGGLLGSYCMCSTQKEIDRGRY
jgi:hypothetical protein